MPTRAATASSAPRVEAPNVKALMEAPMSKSPCRNPRVESEGGLRQALGVNASRRSSERVLGRRQIVQMAGGKVAARRGTQGRLVGAAALEGVGAAGVKAAALGRVDGTWHVALEDNAGARGAGLRHRNSR